MQHPEAKIASLRECPVIYVDPLQQSRPEIAEEIYFCKHFRYAYQNEFRFVLKSVQQSTLTPFFLELGAITDIAEFIEEPIDI